MNITDKFVAEYEKLWRIVRGIKGDGRTIRVTNTPAGIVIAAIPGTDDPRRATARNDTFAARITAVSGSFPLFSYTVQRVISYDTTQTGAARAVTDGVDISAINGFELVANSPTYTHATGVSITASDGTLNSSSCKIQSIGVGAVVIGQLFPNNSGALTFIFSAPNSAQ